MKKSAGQRPMQKSVQKDVYEFEKNAVDHTIFSSLASMSAAFLNTYIRFP